MRRKRALLTTGILAGALAALWAVRFVDSLLFELDARDPATFIGAAAVLAIVGFASAWWPARRASRLTPSRLLRES